MFILSHILLLLCCPYLQISMLWVDLQMCLIRHYHYLHADWWECICVFVRVHGVVGAVFPHLSVGCPSRMATEAPLVPTVLIDVAQYCVGRLGLLFWTSDMLITTPLHCRKGKLLCRCCEAQICIDGELTKGLKLFAFQVFVCKCSVSGSKNNVLENRAV